MKKKILLIIILICVIPLGYYLLTRDYKEIYINAVLDSKAYASLSSEAKKIVKDSYYATGEVIKVEDNKEEGVPYLNPEYIEYISLPYDKQEEYLNIPDVYKVDYYEVESNYEDISSLSYFNAANYENKSYISYYKNQNELGVCWAMTTAEAAETYLMYTNNESYVSGTSQEISVRQIDYGTSTNGINNNSNDYFSGKYYWSSGGRTLGEGGNFLFASIYLASGYSLVDSSWETINNRGYTKDGDDLKKLDNSVVQSFANSKYELTSTVSVPYLNISELNLTDSTDVATKDSYLSYVKNLIATYGSAYVGTISPQSYDGAYISGNDYIIRNTNTTTYNSGHGMQIIGWDDDYEYKYCTYNGSEYIYKASSTACTNGKVNTGTGVWILRNSWGNYITNPLLTYDSIDSDINFITGLESSENKAWDNVYLPSKLTYYITRIYSEEFTKNTNQTEKIEQIKFNAYNYGDTAKVYVDTNDSYINVANVTIDHAGLYTVDISDFDINVTSDFNIEVTSSSVYIVDGSLQVFTSNVDDEYGIYADEFIVKNMDTLTSFNIITRNIDDGENVTYQLYNSSMEEINDNYTITGNTVYSNSINAYISLSDQIQDGNYYLRITYKNISYDVSFVSKIHKGTYDNPIEISTANELYEIKDNMSAYYVLTNDIDLTSYVSYGGDYYNSGHGWSPIGYENYENCDSDDCKPYAFTGTLDGANHTISGLDSRFYDDVGLFYQLGDTSSNATIKNLIIDDAIVINYGYAGALAATSFADNIELSNVAITNSYVRGMYTGGLFGYLSTNTLDINNTYVSARLDPLNVNSTHLYYAPQSDYATAGNIAGFAKITDTVNIDYFEANSLIYTYSYKDIPVSDLFTTKNIFNLNINNSILNNDFGNNNSYLISFNENGDNDYYSYDSKSINLKNVYSVNSLNIENHDNVNSTNSYTYTYKELESADYSLWDDFDTYYSYKGIPNLKNAINTFVDITNNITSINVDINSIGSLCYYMSPEYHYVSQKFNIISDYSDNYYIDYCHFVPLKTGEFNATVVNLYNGDENNITINITSDNPVINFESNGGSIVNSISKEVGTNITKPDDPVKYKHKFIGWYTDKLLTNEYTFDTMPSEDLTLYAKWEYIEYTITFDLMGGTNHTTSLTKYYDVDAYLPKDVPYKYGNTFNYWVAYPEPNAGVTYYPGDVITDNEDLELYAEWDQYLFNLNVTKDSGIDKVYYKVNDGNYTEFDTSNPLEVTKNDTIYLYATPKEGYNIVNNVNETNPYSVSVVSDINYEFTSKLKTYTISYVTGSDTVIKSQTKIHGSNITLSSTIPVKEGYKFLGYSLTEDGNVIYQAGDTFTINNNTVLYAKWEKLIKVSFILREEMTQMCYRLDTEWICADSYTYAYFENGTTVDFALEVQEGYESVHTKENPLTMTLTEDYVYSPEVEALTFNITFNLTGGTGSFNDLVKSYFTSVNLPTSKPTRNGYNFKGWAIEENGTVIYNPGDEITTNGNLDLYAVWEIITYDLNITVSDGITVYYKKKDELNFKTITASITIPVHYGDEYLIYGEMNNEYTGSITCTEAKPCTITITSNYNAVFSASKKTYNITYDLNGGIGNIGNQVKYYNVDITLTNLKPTRKGYTFECWTTEKNSNTCYTSSTYKDNSNITFYAKWKAKTYTININSYSKDSSNNIYINENTLVSNYLKAFSYDSDLTVKVFKDNTELTTSAKVTTGSVIRFYLDNTLKFEYTNIIKGDANGDGKISALDYVKIKNHIMGATTITGNAYYLAADYNSDNKISALDYVKIKNKIMKGS